MLRRPHVAITILLVLICHVLLTAFWYASGSTGPLYNEAHPFVFFRQYGFYVACVFYGFLMALFIQGPYLLKTVFLSVILAGISGVIHRTAGWKAFVSVSVRLGPQ